VSNIEIECKPLIRTVLKKALNQNLVSSPTNIGDFLFFALLNELSVDLIETISTRIHSRSRRVTTHKGISNNHFPINSYCEIAFLLDFNATDDFIMDRNTIMVQLWSLQPIEDSHLIVRLPFQENGD
jgi:hypothetical protein